MNRTFTPRLEPAVLERLEAYAERFRPHFNHPRQALWNGVYLRGLLQEGERKSIEPLSRRVSLPAELASVADPEQALQQFVNQSSWDEMAVAREYRAAMAEALADPAGVLVIDDTTFPKQGRHSVGVQRQYCGALGKKANCQCAVSLHYVAPKGHCPLSMRLYLPPAWLNDPARLDRAGVPPEERWVLTKGQIALELLDQARAEGWPGRVVVADSGYGVSGPFRQELEARGLFYVVGVTEQMVAFAEEPLWEWPQEAPRGAHRPRSRPRLAKDSPQPLSLAELAARTPLRRVTWRNGTKGPLSARFAWLRVWPADGWAQGKCAGAPPHWLLIERREDGSLRYALSNLPATASRLAAVRYWHSRWPVEQGYQQMKEELGLDHFEGRSWHGFHRHAVLVMLAYGFLTLERLQQQQQQQQHQQQQQQQQQQQEADGSAPAVPAREKKRRRGDSDERSGPRLTLPAVRRALQRFLLPACHPDCPYCRTLVHR
jgi:SRSO17 transposase